jgi:hypothetical protein
MKSFLLLSLLISNLAHAQLKCTNTKDSLNNIKTCYHNNGTVSTIESWDSNRRSGKLKAFNKNGKELFNYGLRTFGGHSSVYLSYYPNGQVSKAEYSSAPDGGIQYYHEIYKFDESGNQTEFLDLSRPDGVPGLTHPGIITKKEIQETVACATPHITIYHIVNETKYKANVIIRTVANTNAVAKKETSITLLPKQSLNADSVLTYKFLKQEESYVVELAGKQKGKKEFKLIYGNPEQTANRKVYTWYVLQK